MKRPSHNVTAGGYKLGGQDEANYSAYKVRELRGKAFRWYGKKCAKCGKHNGKKADYVVHHRHYRTFGKETRDDVVVLCEPCHVDLHNRHRLRMLTAADVPLVDPEWAGNLK